MDLRRLQVTGGSTHVVSLPKKWIDRNGLGRSDTVAIHEEPDGSLLLMPHGEIRPPRRPITVTLPDLETPERVVRRIVGAYLAGADEIRITTRRMDPRIRDVVRDLARDLVGVETLEEGPDHVVLQDLVGVSDMDLRKTVTRMHRIARLMFDEALEALAGRDADKAASVRKRDDELDRIEWMVTKQMHGLLEQPRLAARLNVRPAEALNYFLVARSVERMGDHASKISKNVMDLAQTELPDEVTASVQQQADIVRSVWDESFAAMKRGDFAQGSDAVDAGKAAAPWRANFPNLFGGLAPETVAALTLIADSVDRVRGYAIDIAEIGLNHTFHIE